jgi:hypothetical protein
LARIATEVLEAINLYMAGQHCVPCHAAKSWKVCVARQEIGDLKRIFTARSDEMRRDVQIRLRL